MILLFPVLLLLFLVLGLWLAHKGGLLAQSKYQHKFAYVGGFAIVFSLIFGDEIYTWASWHHMCDTKGGVHIYKKVPVEGFLYDVGAVDGIAADFFTREGYKYKYIEGKYSKNYGINRDKLYRYELDEVGKVVKNEIEKPQSQYVYKIETVNHSHFIWSYSSTIRNVKTNELIGIDQTFGTKGGLVMKFLRYITGAEFEGSADYCHFYSEDVIKAAIPSFENTNGEVK